METSAKSHRHVRNRRAEEGRERGKAEAKVEGRNRTGTDTPSTEGVAQSVARSHSSPDWTEAVQWACKRGLLQAQSFHISWREAHQQGSVPSSVKWGQQFWLPLTWRSVAFPITDAVQRGEGGSCLFNQGLAFSQSS